jgi:PAS domain S-box-containing protein
MPPDLAPFFSLAEASVEFIGMCDRDFRPYYVNPAGMRMVGLESLEAACRVKVQDYFFPDDQPFITQEFFPRVVREGQGEVEIRFRHFRTGAAIWMLYNVFNLTDAAGAVVGWATVSRNIHDRKLAEEQLRRRTAELQESAERYQVLAQVLQASLQEKEILLREIHHRVKNNLAVISSLLYFSATRAADERTAALLQEAQDRVRSMALVHENLYRSDKLAAVPFGEYVRTLLGYLLQTYASAAGRVRVRTEVEDIAVNVGVAIPCGLILNELVTNSLKHAFPAPRAGEVRVGLHRGADGRCVVTVADDGVGIPSENDLDTGSLGMFLVRSLVQQLHGEFEIRRADPGTEARLSFSLKAPASLRDGPA